MNVRALRRQINNTQKMRRLGMFPYPHSFNKINPAFINIPQEDRYGKINRNYHEGDSAQLAYQNVRKFPEWYKPYLYNYYNHGYLALYFFFIALYGWTYKKEICAVKGRRSLRNYDHQDCKTLSQKKKFKHAKERVEAGDEQFTRYMHPQHRNEGHH